MPYRRRTTSSSRRSSYRRPTRRAAPRRRASSRRRAPARAQRIVIQLVTTPGGVQASPMNLGSKTLRPMRARF